MASHLLMKIAPSISQRLPDITPVFAHAIRRDASGDDGWSDRVGGRWAKRFAPCTPSIDFHHSSLNVAVYEFRILRSSEKLMHFKIPILDALIEYKIESFQLKEDFLLRGLSDPCYFHES